MFNVFCLQNCIVSFINNKKLLEETVVLVFFIQTAFKILIYDHCIVS